ncbi:MAG: hypothetical protein WKF56_05535 [Candidatus Limnocylindrales bacterium]
MIPNFILLELARERQERLVAELAQERLVAPRSFSVRRSFGRRVIAVGRRIAAEPSLELARSR